MVNAKRVGPIAGTAGVWDDYVEWYATSDLEPPHEPDRADDLSTITESMKTDGWAGRPLLATRYDDERLICQTGSHRLSAARAAGLSEVPVVVIDCASALDVRGEILETAAKRPPPDHGAGRPGFLPGRLHKSALLPW